LAIEVGNWEKTAVIAGILSAGLLLAVLAVQIWATLQTRKAATAAKDSSDAAVAANHRAQVEMAVRLAPFVSIKNVESYAVKDNSGLIILRIDPDTGILDLGQIETTATLFFVIFRLTVVNSGPVAAFRAGYGLGKGFDRASARQQMQDDTGHVDSLIPPNTVTSHDFDIPLEDVRRYRSQDGPPYFVAASVAYQSLDRKGQIVEVEWQLHGSTIQLLRHTAPEPYTEFPVN
jgi:hypothetical protein